MVTSPTTLKEATQRHLRDQFKEKKSCQIAAAATAGATAADLINSNAEGVMDSVSSIALMKCVGWSNAQVALYIFILLGIVATCVFFVSSLISDSFWEGCTMCDKYERRKTGKRVSQHCVEERKGTTEECAKQGRIVVYIVGALVGTLIVSIITYLTMWNLRRRVFTPEFHATNMALRFVG